MKQANEMYTINKTLTKFLLAGNEFTLKMHLKQPVFTYNALGSFTNKKRIQKFTETGDARYIYQNKLDKACV